LFNVAHKYVTKLEIISHIIPIKPKHNEIAYLKYDKQVIFYTNGRYDPDTKIATFAVVQDDNKNIKTGGRLSGQQNSYTVELNGILKALYNVRNNQSATIYLDCLSAIQSIKKYIKSGKIEDRTRFKYKNILEAIRIEYKCIQGLKIKYIPGHQDIPDNYEADLECTDRRNDSTIQNLTDGIHADKYTVTYNNEYCTRYARDFIKDILYEQQHWKYNYTIAEHCNTIFEDVYHSISHHVFNYTEHERFINSAELKPLKLVHQINMIQVNMAKNIWNLRNLFVHNNKTASPRA
jgi:ribonuclease HI